MRTLIVMVVLFAAAAWGADEKKAEMRTYVMGILKKGPMWNAERTPETAKIQEGHMANITKMAAAGKLIVAGPFGDDGDIRGVFIFNAKTADEVRPMAMEDPAIQSGRLVLELHPWYAAEIQVVQK